MDILVRNYVKFWLLPKSKNPADRAIAGFIHFDSFGVIPLGFAPSEKISV